LAYRKEKEMKTIKDYPIENKKVLIRVDFNVPLKDGVIQDDARIVKALPTIRYAVENKAKIILMSHLGRPKGERKPEFSLKPVADHLSKLTSQKVKFIDDCLGPKVEEEVNTLEAGQIALLENLRFHKEETKNDPQFAASLARLGEIYIDDAFGACHRAHASVEGVTQYLPSAFGFLLAKEIEYFSKALSNPDRPFAAILGGAKVADKIRLIDNLLNKVNLLIIGGGMSYTFLKAQGINIGSSILDSEGITIAKDALKKAKQKNVEILLPCDHVIAKEYNETSDSKTIEEIEIPEGWMALDIGPKTAENFIQGLTGAKTIIWNGPLGVCEMSKFKEGSEKVARFIAGLKDTTSIIGGGDTAAAIKQFDLEDKMSHISTGGGASLEYLEGKDLPGIKAILNQDPNKQKVAS